MWRPTKYDKKIVNVGVYGRNDPGLI